MSKKIKFHRQLDQMDCGPICLKMVAAYFGKSISLQQLRDYCQINREGVSMYSIADAAEKIGIHTRGVFLPLSELKEAPMPAIIHWDQNHFVVLFKHRKGNFTVADPGMGIIWYSEQEFLQHWGQDKGNGIALLLDPTPAFFKSEEEEEKKSGFGKFFMYMFRYKKLLAQLFIGFLVGSFLQILIPFLTQSIVDIGIPTQDMALINLLLIAQFALLIGRTGVDFIRSWILLHISTRLNIFVLTDFFSKLMRLPISFFDSKKTGDILQRIDDQKRIESFLTGQTLNIGFSIFNLLIFSMVLAFYNLKVFGIFILGTVLYGVWIYVFLERRKQLDYKRFDISAKTQSTTIQLVQGMQEIKLSGTEKKKRWDWEHLQAKLFHFNVRSLALGQYQQAGGVFFNEGKNLLIIYVVATAVISGDMSLGGLVAVQYIIGQLSSPVEQFLSFVQSYQDAKLSLERLNDLYELEDEEGESKLLYNELPESVTISLKGVSFSYPGGKPVLTDLTLYIPQGKTTAIVGVSGSGKTTLVKLLLGFYQSYHGDIKIGDISLEQFNPKFWKLQCGVVMQDSFIFSDSIEANITLSEKPVDKSLLKKAIQMACLEDFVRLLPNGLKTQIGAEGNGISQGQKQRILIARAIYKQAPFVFFDEATNALDANNEKAIIENLNSFFVNRTVVVVAHRLSTVKTADNIVVLDGGGIVEQGTHHHLLGLKGKYYELVSNQLELEN
ncbi:MAG: peptidase domain-containing ABC transporter [Pseudosphingobacterium sp.]|nr:peptidase domain-containing ABC transporter [Pseudosphingobacterium sp.]